MDAEVQEMEVAGTMEEVMATEVVVGARTEVAMVAVELAEETVEEADVVEVEVGIEANTTL